MTELHETVVRNLQAQALDDARDADALGLRHVAQGCRDEAYRYGLWLRAHAQLDYAGWEAPQSFADDLRAMAMAAPVAP